MQASQPITPNLPELHEASPPRPIAARGLMAAFHTFLDAAPIWACGLAGAAIGTLLAWVTVP